MIDATHYGLLARWPVHVQESLFRFFQIAGDGVQITDTENANSVYVQYERDGIARAINRAVAAMVPYLGFYPRPVWLPDPITLTIRGKYPWYKQTYTLGQGYLIEFGRRATSEISSDVEVSYGDTNSDTVDDQATISFSSTVDPSEIQVFFRVEDGAPSAAHEFWRIEPLQVTSDGATVTITGHKALFAHPSVLWANPFTGPNYRTPNVGNVKQSAHFVTAIDVYRVYNDPDGAVTVENDPRIATTESVEVTPWVKDADLGEFTVRLLTDTPAAPRKVKAYVRVGMSETSDGLMRPELETAILRLANTTLVESGAKNSHPRDVFKRDFEPLTEAELTARASWTPPEFGQQRGAVLAWRTVKQMRIETLAKIPAEEYRGF